MLGRPGIWSALIFLIRRAMHKSKLVLIGWILFAAATCALAQARRKIIINEDCSGPGGSNMQTLRCSSNRRKWRFWGLRW